MDGPVFPGDGPGPEPQQPGPAPLEPAAESFRNSGTEVTTASAAPEGPTAPMTAAESSALASVVLPCCPAQTSNLPEP